MVPYSAISKFIIGLIFIPTDGAELTAHAVCQVTRQNEKDWGSTEIMKIQQEPKEGMQGLALVPVTSLQPQTSLTTGMIH